jgi:hypothetical protein
LGNGIIVHYEGSSGTPQRASTIHYHRFYAQRQNKNGIMNKKIAKIVCIGFYKSYHEMSRLKFSGTLADNYAIKLTLI